MTRSLQAGIGRLGVAVTMAPAGALLVLVATVGLAVFNRGDRPASGAADQPPRPMIGQAAPRCTRRSRSSTTPVRAQATMEDAS
jgi:hypothetical protein